MQIYKLINFKILIIKNCTEVLDQYSDKIIKQSKNENFTI